MTSSSHISSESIDRRTSSLNENQDFLQNELSALNFYTPSRSRTSSESFDNRANYLTESQNVLQNELNTLKELNTLAANTLLPHQTGVENSPSSQNTYAPLTGRTKLEDAIHAFKTEINEAKSKSDAELKESQKNATNVKIKKVATIALIGLAGVLIVAGVAAACAFCPPIGAVILAVGLTVIASGGIGAGIYNWPMDAPKEDREQMEQAGKDLDEALRLFEKYPKQATPDETSFEEFLEKCPYTYNETLQAPSYKLKDIGKYVSLFEKNLKLQEKEKEGNNLQEEIRNLESQSNQLASELEIYTTEDCEAAIKKLEEDHVNLDGKLAKKNNDIQNQETQIPGIIDKIRQNNNRLKNERLKNEAAIKRLHEDNSKLVKDLHEKNNDITQIPGIIDKIEQNKKKINQLKDQLKNEEAIKKLQKDNSELVKDFHKKNNDIQNQKTQIQDIVNKIEQNKEKIDQLTKLKNQLIELKDESLRAIHIKEEIAILNGEYQSAKNTLEKEIQNESVTPYIDGIRKSGLKLDTWLETPVKVPDLNTTIDIKPDENSIYTFGTLAKQPSHGMYVKESPEFRGTALNMSEAQYRALGYDTENNFLSNAYTGEPLTIDGKTYKSVTHYMLLTKLDRLPKPISSEGKAQSEKLKNDIENAPTAEGALKLMHHSAERLFDGMDKDLRKALFYKFVDPNGELTKAGVKLLATDNKQLYAGYEHGDPSYGVQFINQDKMQGQNKLGIYLMELRKQLKTQVAP